MKLRSASGFTLFEVVLASAIFVLLAGAIFFSVSTAVSAADQLGRAQVESRRLAAFGDFLRDGFRNLPQDSAVSVRSRSAGERGSVVELIIRRAAGAFPTGVLESRGGGVVLGLLPDGRGAGTFSLIRFPDRISDSDLDRQLDSSSWLPVLEEVSSVRWRFWDSGRNGFAEAWERTDSLPELIELTLQCQGGEEQVSVFALPRLARNAAAARTGPRQARLETP